MNFNGMFNQNLNNMNNMNMMNNMNNMNMMNNQMNNTMNMNMMNNNMNNQLQFDPMNNDFTNNQMMNTMNQMNPFNPSPMQNNMDMTNPVLFFANLMNNIQLLNQMQQMNQMMNNQFTLKFTIDDGRNTIIIIPCQAEENMGNVILRFFQKIGYNDPNAKFIHNAKNINPSLSIAELGLLNGSVIQVLFSGRVRGGYLSKNIINKF